VADGRTRVLVLGGSGMLGSMVVDVLGRDPGLAVTATVRSDALRSALAPRYGDVRWRVFDPAAGVPPELFAGQAWVINAIGLTKPLIRDDRWAEIERAIEINASLPHRVARAAGEAGARVIQIATDCVYAGTKGAYGEDDPHDAHDVYGKTKSLGETFQDNVAHLRCSIVGPEPKEFKFLLEWFRRQPRGARVQGFVNHRWNGVTTLHFARLCRALVAGGPWPGHLLHVVPTGTLSKAEMLHLFAEVYARGDVAIDDVPARAVVDRTLATQRPEVNAALWSAAGYERPPTVEAMVRELAAFDDRATGA
jgi:dTDP-4-dehydrorhamnose reductase